MGQIIGGARRADGANGDAEGGAGPPLSNAGLYFGNQFTLGGQTFPSMSPESFLFGDMNDLSLLSRLPGAMPRVPPNLKHTNTVRALVNAHKASLKLVRDPNSSAENPSFNVAVTLDADVSCKVQVHLFAEEVVSKTGDLSFKPCLPEYPSMPPVTVSPGYGMPVVATSRPIADLLKVSGQHLAVSTRAGRPMRFPFVLEVVANLPGANTHSLITYATLEKGGEAGMSFRIVAQKVNADGRAYLLREIYGIEHKTERGDGKVAEDDDDSDEEEEDTECVVCMSESMDTMVLPCRHLCLCNNCAEVLRYQASKCPICRAPFHSLLKISVAKREEDLTPEQLDREQSEEETPPPGYRLVPVVEALRSSRATIDMRHGYMTITEQAAAAASDEDTPNTAAAAPQTLEEVSVVPDMDEDDE